MMRTTNMPDRPDDFEAEPMTQAQWRALAKEAIEDAERAQDEAEKARLLELAQDFLIAANRVRYIAPK